MVATPASSDAEASGEAEHRRSTLNALGPLLRRRLETALAAAEAAGGGRPLVALDAGCGGRTVFRGVRHRIGRLIGVDVHPPSEPVRDLDEYVVADLCAGPLPIPDGCVDVAASIFTLEHFADPVAALRTIAATLAPTAASSWRRSTVGIPSSRHTSSYRQRSAVGRSAS